MVANFVKTFYFIKMFHTNTSSSRVQRKRQIKSDRILDCAMVLLAEGGIAAVTIQSIAEAMDLTVGALYRYFPSKSAILGAMTRRTLAELSAVLESTPEADSSGLQRLRLIAEGHINFCRSNPAHFFLISQMMSSPRIVLPPSERVESMTSAFALISFVEQQVRMAQDEGSIRTGDPRAYALAFWSAIHGALQLDKFGRLDPAEMHREDIPIRVAEDLLISWGLNVV